MAKVKEQVNEEIVNKPVNLEKIAEEAGLKIVDGKVTIEPSEPTVRNSFLTKTQEKKNKVRKLDSQVDREERTPRQETVVVKTDNWLKQSVAGNSLVGTIGGVRFTVPHKDLMEYVEGLTTSIRVYEIRPKE